MFFSAPLDESGCCRYDWAGNCNKFVQIDMNKFMCDRCKLGYKWVDNNCEEIDEDEDCINPEMKAIPFYPCKVCRFDEDRQLIPIYNPDESDKYTCESLDSAEMSEIDTDRIKNCIATGASGKSIFCYRCKNGYVLNWKSQVCESIKQKKLHGCLISIDEIHCSVCISKYQYDSDHRICVSREVQIAYKKPVQR